MVFTPERSVYSVQCTYTVEAYPWDIIMLMAVQKHNHAFIWPPCYRIVLKFDNFTFFLSSHGLSVTICLVRYSVFEVYYDVAVA